MATIETILPIFIIIFLGFFARQHGFITNEILSPTNRLIYYFAIPALVFRAISRASLIHEFHGEVLLTTLSAVVIVYGSTWLVCKIIKASPMRAGAIIICSAHGNLGYIGLPFAYYFLGESGLVKAGIISGFLTIIQNILTILILHSFSQSRHHRNGIKTVLRRLINSPVILASAGGIVASGFNIQIPIILQKTLDILGGLAPPMALLLIGASISFKSILIYIRPSTGVALVKLLLVPIIGLALYQTFEIPPTSYLPGLILLACPTATIAYIMGRELCSDSDFIAATISTSTLLSLASFLFWMNFVTHLS